MGLKRGLAEDLVIAPYASALALMVAPEAACNNLERLAADGHLGMYGFMKQWITRHRDCLRVQRVQQFDSSWPITRG